MKNVIKQITHGNRNTKFLFDVINYEIPRGCEIADSVINFSVCCRDVFRGLKSRTWSFEQTEQICRSQVGAFEIPWMSPSKDIRLDLLLMRRSDVIWIVVGIARRGRSARCVASWNGRCETRIFRRVELSGG